MADLEQAHAMLRMAHKDFNALVGMGENALFADEIFGFHVQQAAEKALKAWLCTCGGGTYPSTHELARLLTLLENHGAEVEAFWPLVEYTMFEAQGQVFLDHTGPCKDRVQISLSNTDGPMRCFQ